MITDPYIRDVVNESGRREITTDMIIEGELRRIEAGPGTTDFGLLGWQHKIGVAAARPLYDYAYAQQQAAMSGQYRGFSYCPYCGSSLRQGGCSGLFGSLMGGQW